MSNSILPKETTWPDDGTGPDAFELLYKHHLFKVERSWYFNAHDWDVSFIRYEGKLQLYGSAHTEVRKEIEEAIRFYDKTRNEFGPYADLSLSEFLAKVLPD